MRLIRYIPLIVLLSAFSINSQDLGNRTSIDSLGCFNTLNLKAISKLLTELEYRREDTKLLKEELNQYKLSLSEVLEALNLKTQQIEILKSELPEFYERPLFVMTATALVLGVIYYLMR